MHPSHWHDGSQGSPSFSFAAQRHRSGAFQIKMHLSSDSLQLKADQFSITRSSQMSPMMAAVPIRSTTRHQTTWLFRISWRGLEALFGDEATRSRRHSPGAKRRVTEASSRSHWEANRSSLLVRKWRDRRGRQPMTKSACSASWPHCKAKGTNPRALRAAAQPLQTVETERRCESMQLREEPCIMDVFADPNPVRSDKQNREKTITLSW